MNSTFTRDSMWWQCQLPPNETRGRENRKRQDGWGWHALQENRNQIWTWLRMWMNETISFGVALAIYNWLRNRLRDSTLAHTAAIQELAAQMARFEERLDNLEIRLQHLNSIKDVSFSSRSRRACASPAWSDLFIERSLISLHFPNFPWYFWPSSNLRAMQYIDYFNGIE